MSESSAFINISLKGAHGLLHAAHDYVKWQAPLDIQHMDKEAIFKVSREAMRVTVRVTQIIAWLMLQKAVLEGELSRQEIFSEEFRVLHGRLCVEKGSEMDTNLPPRLRELLKESRELYERIVRLDEISRKQPLTTRKRSKRLVSVQK